MTGFTPAHDMSSKISTKKILLCHKSHLVLFNEGEV